MELPIGTVISSTYSTSGVHNNLSYNVQASTAYCILNKDHENDTIEIADLWVLELPEHNMIVPADVFKAENATKLMPLDEYGIMIKDTYATEGGEQITKINDIINIYAFNDRIHGKIMVDEEEQLYNFSKDVVRPLTLSELVDAERAFNARYRSIEDYWTAPFNPDTQEKVNASDKNTSSYNNDYEEEEELLVEASLVDDLVVDVKDFTETIEEFLGDKTHKYLNVSNLNSIRELCKNMKNKLKDYNEQFVEFAISSTNE